MTDDFSGGDFSAELAGAVLTVTGEVDMATAPRLRAVLAEAVRRPGPPLVVDLSQVRYLDSAGVGALFEHVHRGLELVVAPGSPVARVLQVTGLTEVATVRPPV